MDIELYNGDAKAIVSTNGGYLTNLANIRGDILFPKRTLLAPDGGQKVRGGCHVCLPNFGPGGESGLAQHGFGRSSNWAVVATTENTVELAQHGEGEYVDMESILHYELQQGSLKMALTLKNRGEHPLKVAPGFHPYFATGSTLPIVNSVLEQDSSRYGVAQFLSGDMQYLTAGGRNLTLSSTGLPNWAVWTDRVESYICVEPTENGNAFVDEDTQPRTLLPDQEAFYTMTIDWS